MTATGGTGELQYRFYRIKDGVTTVFRDYDNSHIAYSNPPEAGDYILYVDVKDEAGNSATQELKYTWSDSSKDLKIQSLTTSKASPQSKGTSIQLVTMASGGTGELQYRFYRSINGKTTVFRDFSPDRAAYCNPPEPGKYTILVDVKDESGNIVTEHISYEWK